MKKFHTLKASDISSFLNSDEVVALVAKSDINKPLFLAKMLPVRDNGLFCYSTSSDQMALVPCVVVQSRYPLDDNYKIELVPTETGFGRQSYYLSDFAQLLRAGEFHVIDQSAGDIVELMGIAGLVQNLQERFSSMRSKSERPQQKASLKMLAVRRFAVLFSQPEPIRRPE